MNKKDNIHIKEITEEEYNKYLRSNFKKLEKALNHALDIRKFEIELYWKRTAYFWAFIAFAFAGFFATQSSDTVNKDVLSILISCVGLVFSLAWFLANKASKRWQENWEKHVDLLENDVHGPLYKINLKSADLAEQENTINKFITGAGDYSVSKINQITSLYITLVWSGILGYSIHSISYNTSKFLLSFFVILSLLTCYLFFKIGKTSEKTPTIKAFKRDNNFK